MSETKIRCKGCDSTLGIPNEDGSVICSGCGHIFRTVAKPLFFEKNNEPMNQDEDDSDYGSLLDAVIRNREKDNPIQTYFNGEKSDGKLHGFNSEKYTTQEQQADLIYSAPAVRERLKLGIERRMDYLIGVGTWERIQQLLQHRALYTSSLNQMQGHQDGCRYFYDSINNLEDIILQELAITREKL